ncbi:major facilitator superfamily domain-containing protein [Boletus edulis BED1]|uniref:Major facilitator superfamily domain-containing protein n=1 Tax=Boletus edulis BED1 TaxID=1328754 RepID=A0AAD4BZ31_BOLED|nr:major facilitator superfamily domain-containing protein [Boletus edulis BED1]
MSSKKGVKLWLIFASMCACLLLSALELSSVSTALPTIANALHSSQFTWVGAAYSLASTAFLPMSGGFAQTFGRRPAVLLTIGLFALGSGICGGANSMNMLIAGRTVQGLGGGGIQSLTAIILADLVTFTWCLAASIGPVVGGSLATQGQWGWLFYLNLPISLVASVLVVLLLDLPTPPGTYREKIMRMDWIGNFLVIASTTASTIGFTWGGTTAPWGSVNVVIPLVLGLIGLGAFIVYEATVAKYPLHDDSTDYFPIYFQACKGVSPTVSGIYSLSFASYGAAAIIIGMTIKATGRYRVQTWIGWIFAVIALGLMSTIPRNGPTRKIYCGLMVSATPVYPIQAPLPVAQSASALAFMWFLRSFASVWGIAIGGTVIQNQLAKKLPASFIESVPQGTALVYALIPELSKLPPQTLSEVQAAFADSLAAGAGLLVSLFMRGLPLHNTLDEDWVLKDEKVDPSLI